MYWKITLLLFCLLSLVGIAAYLSKAATIMQENEELSRRASQFFNDWLVKQNRAQAQKFLSPSPIACFSVDKNIRSQGEVKQAFSAVLSKANQELGKRRSVAEAIEAFSLGKKYKEVEHPARTSFSISIIPNDEFETYLCETDLAKLSQQGIDTQQLFLVTFTFKVPEDKKGGLLFVWAKEKNEWRILTFDALSF